MSPMSTRSAASPLSLDTTAATPRSTAILAGLALAILLVPVWSVVIPPLNDYLNHLARMFIYAHLGDDADLRKMYELRLVLVPNLAMDAIVPLFMRVMPLHDAGRVFVSLILALWVLGPLLLHRALYGRFSAWPLAAAFFAYNAVFAWGFVNYLFGAGLVFVALAAWVRADRLAPLVRLALFTLLSVALYFSHLVAFAIYGLCVAAYELGRLPELRRQPAAAWLSRLGPAAGQFLAAAILFLFVSPSGKRFDAGGLAGLEISLNNFHDLAQGVRAPIWVELGVIDYLSFAFLAAVIVLGLLSRRLTVHQRFLLPLLALGAVAGILVLFKLSIDDVLLRIRFTPVLACLFVAASSWRVEGARRLLVAAFAVGAALFVGRMALVTDRWADYDRQFTEFRQALAVVPKGSAIFQALVDNPPIEPPRLHGYGEYPYEFMTELATIERSAFSPLLFTFGELQILRTTPAYRPFTVGEATELPWEELPAHAAVAAPSHFQDNWPQHFDYLVALDPAGRDESLKQWLTPVHRGSFFTIFRIAKPAGATGSR
jgi:hypothetical protein